MTQVNLLNLDAMALVLSCIGMPCWIVTGNRDLEDRGKAEKTAGKVEKKIGDIKKVFDK